MERCNDVAQSRQPGAELTSAVQVRCDTGSSGRSSDEARIRVDHGCPRALAILRSDGYYVGLRLTQGALTELLSRVQQATCYADGEATLPFQAEHKSQAEARYARRFGGASYLRQQEVWPEFRALCEDRALLDLATHYLECTPVYLGSELCWSYPQADGAQPPRRPNGAERGGQPPAARLSFAFYLTDVGSGDGPHRYVKKSRARPSSPATSTQRCDERAEPDLSGTTEGSEQSVIIYGPRGLGYAGDPRFLRRRAPSNQREQLLLRIELGSRAGAARTGGNDARI